MRTIIPDQSDEIESLNSVIRKAIKSRKVLPYDSALLKATWFAILSATQNYFKIPDKT